MWSSITHNETFKVGPPVEVFEVPRDREHEVTHLKPLESGSVLVKFPKATEEAKKIQGITNTKHIRYNNHDVAKAQQIGVIKVIAKTSGRVLIILHWDDKPQQSIRTHLDSCYKKVKTPMAVRANKSKRRFEVTDDTTIQTQIDEHFPSGSLRSPVMAAAESANTPSKRSGHSMKTRSSPVSSLGALGLTPPSGF